MSNLSPNLTTSIVNKTKTSKVGTSEDQHEINTLFQLHNPFSL